MRTLAAISALSLAACSQPAPSKAKNEVLEVSVRMSVCLGHKAAYWFPDTALRWAPTGPFRTQVDCMLAAKDCAGFLTCFGTSIDAELAPADPMVVNHCEGSSYVTQLHTDYGTRYLQKQDCAAIDPHNPTCYDNGDGSGVCGAGRCDTPGMTCNGAQIISQCLSNGVLGVTSCEDEGLQCNGSDGNWWCGGSGVACDQNTCEDQLLHVCSSGRESIVIDCGNYDSGLYCWDETKAGGGCGVKFDDRECEPGASVCDGAVAKYCLGGRWQVFDCPSFLDSTCTLDSQLDPVCRSASWGG